MTALVEWWCLSDLRILLYSRSILQVEPMFLNTSRLRQTVGSMIESRRRMQSTTRWPMAKVILMVQLGSFCSAVHLSSRTFFHVGRRLGARPSADRRCRSTPASAVQSRRAREHRRFNYKTSVRSPVRGHSLSFCLWLGKNLSCRSLSPVPSLPIAP